MLAVPIQCTHQAGPTLPCPAARLLAPGEGQPPGQAAFALFGKTGRSPRVHCCASREALLKAMQVRALLWCHRPAASSTGLFIAAASSTQSGVPSIRCRTPLASSELLFQAAFCLCSNRGWPLFVPRQPVLLFLTARDAQSILGLRHSPAMRLQAAALRKLGLTLAVDSNAQLTGAKLLATVAAAERERAASASDAPLGEWEVMRVKDMDAGACRQERGVRGTRLTPARTYRECGRQLCCQGTQGARTPASAGQPCPALAPPCCAADLAAARATSDAGGWNGVAHRRLVLTHAGLLERRPGDYEVGACMSRPEGLGPETPAGCVLPVLSHVAAAAALAVACAQLCCAWPCLQVAEWRQLPAIAALVRFGEDPQWLAVEWADGTPAATYVTPARCGPQHGPVLLAGELTGWPCIAQPAAPFTRVAMCWLVEWWWAGLG